MRKVLVKLQVTMIKSLRMYVIMNQVSQGVAQILMTVIYFNLFSKQVNEYTLMVLVIINMTLNYDDYH